MTLLIFSDTDILSKNKRYGDSRRSNRANLMVQTKIRSIKSRLINLMCRSSADKWLLCKVFVLLGLCRFAINVFSFHRLEKYMGARLTETAATIPQGQLQIARKIHWAIHIISPFTPWTSNCFPQALCAKILLRRAGISSTLYMGAVFKPEGAALKGHAWLRCGPYYVTGGDSSKDFGAIASFGE